MRQSNSGIVAAGYRTGVIALDVDGGPGDPVVVALAVHVLLDRVFTIRTDIVIAAGPDTRPFRVDVSAVDPDTHTPADLHRLHLAASESPAAPTVGGHLISIGGATDELIDRLRPATALGFDPATGTLTLSTADRLGIDEHDVLTSIARLWSPSAWATDGLPIQQIAATLAADLCTGAGHLAPIEGQPQQFVTRFVAVARAHPDRVAIETATRTITYAELNATANAIAADLSDRGLRRGDVLLLVPRRDEQLVAIVVAAMKLGVALAIANPAAPPAYLRVCAEAANAAAVVDMAGLELPDAWRDLPAAPTGTEDERYDQERLGPDECAVVTFTSGTSGTPKAVRGRYSSLTYFFDWMDRHLGPLRDARFGMCSALGHDPLQRDIITPLYLGATIVVPPAEEMVSAAFGQWLDESGVQVVCVNPSAITLLAIAARTLTQLRMVFLVGSTLTREHVETLVALAPRARIVNLYGATETQRAVAFFEVDRQDSELPAIVPVGHGMADVDVLVLTAAGRVCVPWQTGQIAVRSPQIALGYIGDPALTEARFRTGLPAGTPPADDTPTYLTGDLGYRTIRYGVHYAGRADSQVKINGYRVELHDLTARCLAMPAVRDAAAISFDLDDAPALAVFLVPESPTIRFEPNAFRAALAERLPSYMLPHRVITIPGLPMTHNRKIDTDALGRYLEDPDAPAPTASHGSAGVVHDYLRRLTGVDDPDLSVPLADLGVDSLRFAALLGRLPASARADATTALSATELLTGLDGAAPRTRPAATTGNGAAEPLDVRKLLGPITRVTETAIEAAGRRLDHLCSNSYLGLSSDPRIRAGLVEFVRTTPSLGSHGSPEVNGYTLTHERLAGNLRALLDRDTVILYSSAYLANISAIPALAGPGDQLFVDERCHRSVRDGCLMSEATLHPFRHNDSDDLDAALRRTRTGGRRVIVSEAIFSVGGDIVDLPGLATCAREHDALLILDEASSIGQLGDGRGIEAHYELPGCVDVRIGSLGKALAAGGGFVACSGEFATRLRRHRGATFSTALSPLAAHLAADAVGLVLDDGPALTARLHTNRTIWAEALQAAGFDIGSSQSSIVPLYLPGADDTARWFHAALDAGIFALPLSGNWTGRPGGGLRTTVTAVHDPDALGEIADRLVRSLTVTAAR
ncbi:aminotransferase class I/II-fold pyridoxal phosphate-dependent enzyme [Nocardia transvalensis]|uniref:aminotransferase class I/II-fold pyridoxal phosphate-dependent enzyme n=1 Tax=Nocardia transvalensis TaxID=37333 RepID=UPI0018949210|nr:aminotransferase class I/II-fold pyridoxal phosphate-dependent enzyme [Nocardia transvalensis]MBF6328292.1 aminotransferase class I/II-fold pyridoxal phosphate-dependent enzyme [Nocardia transvalensis]